MTAPAREKIPTSTLLKIWMRLHFACACLRARHVAIIWSPRVGKGDRIGFVGLDQKLVHQTENATFFLSERLREQQQVLDLVAEVEARE